MEAGYITVVIISSAASMWYITKFGRRYAVEFNSDERLIYYKLKGHPNKIIFKSDCKVVR